MLAFPQLLTLLLLGFTRVCQCAVLPTERLDASSATEIFDARDASPDTEILDSRATNVTDVENVARGIPQGCYKVKGFVTVGGWDEKYTLTLTVTGPKGYSKIISRAGLGGGEDVINAVKDESNIHIDWAHKTFSVHAGFERDYRGVISFFEQPVNRCNLVVCVLIQTNINICGGTQNCENIPTPTVDSCTD